MIFKVNEQTKNMGNKRTQTTNRRDLIKVSGAGLTALNLPVAGVSATSMGSIPNEKKNRALLTKRYGQEAADTTINIIHKYRRQLKSGNISQKEYHDRITKELLETTVANEVGENVRKTDKEIEYNLQNQAEKIEIQNQDFNSSQFTLPDVSTNKNLLIGRYNSDTFGSGLSSSDTDIVFGCPGGGSTCPNKIADIMKSRSTAGIYGSTWGKVQFYQNFQPSQTGDYNFDLSYYRNGDSTAGSTELSLYTIDSSGSMNKKRVESPSGETDGDKTVNKTFNLVAGDDYKVGFELYTSASSAGGGSFSDYYSNKQGVDPSFLLDWEYRG